MQLLRLASVEPHPSLELPVLDRLRAVHKNGDALTLELTRAELMAAANALNEVL